MSEQVVTEGTSNGANGVSASNVPHESPTPGAAGDARAVSRAAARAAFLADTAPKADAVEEPAADAEPEVEAAAEEPDAEEPEAAEEDAEPEPEVEAKDPSRDKRIESVQKQEKRALERVAQERAKFDAERNAHLAERKRFETEWGPRIEAAQKFESLKEQAQHDLTGVLEALGVTDADFEFHAQQLYRLSPKGKADPKNRDAYERAARDREHRTKLSAAEKRIAEMEKRMEDRERAQIDERRLGAMVQKAQASLDDAPIMRKRFESHPEQAQSDFAIAVKFLREQTGQEPDPADVIRELEAIEQENARVRGFTIPTKAAPTGAAAPKTKTNPAGETKSAPKKTSISEPGNSQPRNPRVVREEFRSAFVAAGGKGRTA